MFVHLPILILGCLALSSLAVSTSDQKAYPEFAELLAEKGYEWEAHETKTEDGYYLTLFRVFGVHGQTQLTSQNITYDSSENYPLLMVHGAMDSGLGFMQRAFFGTTWTLQMVNAGYDVWFHNSRGIKYSDKHERQDEMTRQEYWNFTWADMGYYDLPVSINKIREVTGSPKVTVIAHSQGTSMMWYAMAHRQDFFAESVHHFIALASCIIPTMYAGLTTYEHVVAYFLKTEELGVTNLFGYDETSMPIWELMCKTNENSPWCLVPNNILDTLDGIGFFHAYPNSAWAFLYFGQLFLEGRFQEPQTLKKYAQGERTTPLVPVWNIDRVPVTFVHGSKDKRCPLYQAEHLFNEITTPDKRFLLHNADHYFYMSSSDPSWVSDIDQIIKQGQISELSSSAISELMIGVSLIISIAL